MTHPATACEVRVPADGSVEALSAAQHIGAGTRTVLAQVVAEEFGLKFGEVGVYIGDTRYPPGAPSGLSRVTVHSRPARNAAWRAARELAARLAPVIDATPDDIVFTAGKCSRQAGLGHALPGRC